MEWLLAFQVFNIIAHSHSGYVRIKNIFRPYFTTEKETNG